MAKRISNEPVQYQNLTTGQRSVANKIVSDFGNDFSNQARKAGQAQLDAWDRNPVQKNAAKRAKGRRLMAIADSHTDKPLTLGRATRNRVSAVERAAAPEHRMPGENMAGAGWYYDAHSKIDEKSAGLDFDRVTKASSIMSPGVDPESERHATGALAAAHADPEAHVHFSGELVAGLRAAGHGVPVPVGTTLHPSKVPAHLIPALAQEEHRAAVAPNSKGVDWEGINRVASRTNIEKATKVMRGDVSLADAQNPYTAPKTWGYDDNLRRAAPGTPEHMEYVMRADHLASAIRGEHHGGQEMFDFHGLRGSNDGLLSNKGHTAEDSWMRAISVGHPDPRTMKGAGDIGPSRKSYTTQGPNGPETHSASKDARVNGANMYHAWNNHATHLAAKELQKKYGLSYTVPSTLVQETAWTQVRREVGADPDFNANRREAAKAAKPARQAAPTSADLLPGMNSAQFKRVAKGPA